MNKLKSLWPDLVAVLFFIVVSFAYFFPADMEGRMLVGHDNTAAQGSGREAQEYYQRTGERTRWTNSIFGGMPTYQMGPSYGSTDKLQVAANAYHLWLPDYVWYVFVSMLGFFILLRAFNFRTWMAALGAVIWAFSSYFFIIIAAGHIWKVMALAYIPPTLAGMVLVYRGKYLWGGVLTAFFVAMQINANHVQMSYYFLMVVLCMFVAFAIGAVQQKRVGAFVKGTCVLAVAALIGICVNLSNLYHTYEYSKETMRGKSELVHQKSEDAANQTKGGLTRDYITQWSYGIGETWSLLVPNVKGGASVPIGDNKTAMGKANSTYSPIYQQLGQYWGEQPGTSGPVYVGAFVLMLFILGLFIVKGPMKWGLLVATVLSILLSWGKNFMGFTDFFLDYVPMYDKFRAVSSILVVAEFTIPLLAMLALKELVESPDRLKGRLKYVYISAGLTGGVALLFALMPGVFFDSFVSTSEMQMLQGAVKDGYIPSEMLGGLINNLTEMRTAIFTADAWRSFFIVAIGLVVLLLFNTKKLNGLATVGIILVVCLLDMWTVNKRYLNDEMFQEPSMRTANLVETPADEQILQDKSLDYRVLNFAGNTFNENNTAYWHKSIGGYHPAKLRRYQELIEARITPEMSALGSAVVNTAGDLTKVNADSLSPVLNMLNTKYYIFPAGNNTTLPVPNPAANGNAWFVSKINYVNNANEELDALQGLDTKNVAVVDKKFQSALSNAAAIEPKDSASTVKLLAYEPNDLKYEVNSQKGGVVVFAEVYYPGWQATIDGKPAEHARANYVLRALSVPAGKHTVEFKFDPASLHTTETIANIALLLMLVGIIAAIGWSLFKGKKSEKEPQA